MRPILQKAFDLKKVMNRRRFLFLAGAGVASGTAAIHSSEGKTARFLTERLGDLVKPCSKTRHFPSPADWSNNGVTAAWLGHSTVLINFYGVNIITDPVLYSRIGASIGIGTIGPIRRVDCALARKDLPKIDLVLLSHAHLDHFDIPSLRCFKNAPQAVSAPNTSDLFLDTPIRKITELKWGQKSVVATDSGDIEVEAFEVKHWGARWRTDTQRGYNGYILSRGGKKIIFGGDTAMISSFADLKSKGPFDLACMPIGAYQPWIMSHCNPEQALQMANEAGARYFLPIHHSTFRLGREIHTEPMERLKAALSKEPERLALQETGETFTLTA
ncbi:MAG: MBL fold metallo-hydrolase [Verrucomicrobiales bacterium]